MTALSPAKGFALLLTGALLAPAALPAQEAPAPVENPMTALPAEALSMGEEEDGPGSGYLAATHGDWEVRCIRIPDEVDPCQMYQRLFTEDGEAVAEIVMFNLPPGGEAVAAAEIVTPLGTILTQQIALSVDGGQVRRYPFRFCDPMGCVAQIGFTEAEVQAFRRGRAVQMVIAHLSLEEPFAVPISLMGFTASFEQVSESNPY